MTISVTKQQLIESIKQSISNTFHPKYTTNAEADAAYFMAIYISLRFTSGLLTDSVQLAGPFFFPSSQTTSGHDHLQK